MRVNFWSWYMCIYLWLGRSSIILKFDSRNYLYQRLRLWMILWSECFAFYRALFLYVQVMICACVEHTDTGGYAQVCVYVCLVTIIHYFLFIIFFSFFFFRRLFVCFIFPSSFNFIWYNADIGINKSPTQLAIRGSERISFHHAALGDPW